VVRLGELVKAGVDRRLTPEARMGLSLSGGLDARTILAVVDEERFPMTTVCLGLPGCIDQRAARRMAALTASRHCDFMIGGAFLARFEEHLRELVWLTDGHLMSQVLSLPTLPKYRELGIEVLLRGHAGELLHMRKAYDFSLDPELVAVGDEARLEAWLQQRLGGWMLRGVEGPLLRGMTGEELGERARALLRGVLDELGEDDPPVHRVWRLFIAQRLRRQVAMAMLEFGSLVRVRLPYLDNDLVDAVLASPPSLKLGDAVQGRLLARCRPEFLRIANANTSVRIGAGPLRSWAGTFRRRALAKLRLPGYQPYERLGLWLRHQLRPLAERILLDPRCLDRGVFEPETVRRVLAAHASQGANHTYLIMALMSFELGQRMLLEDDARQLARAA
jgi:asparagine synthetase B (glutamine-hydrolysing)